MLRWRISMQLPPKNTAKQQVEGKIALPINCRLFSNILFVEKLSSAFTILDYINQETNIKTIIFEQELSAIELETFAMNNHHPDIEIKFDDTCKLSRATWESFASLNQATQVVFREFSICDDPGQPYRKAGLEQIKKFVCLNKKATHVTFSGDWGIQNLSFIQGNKTITDLNLHGYKNYGETLSEEELCLLRENNIINVRVGYAWKTIPPEGWIVVDKVEERPRGIVIGHP